MTVYGRQRLVLGFKQRPNMSVFVKKGQVRHVFVEFNDKTKILSDKTQPNHWNRPFHLQRLALKSLDLNNLLPCSKIKCVNPFSIS